MRTPSFNQVIAPLLLLAGAAVAQQLTVTLPYLDGDTIVISTGTNVLGLPTTQTLRTVTGTATGVVTTPLATTTPRTGLTTTGLVTATTPTTRLTTTLPTTRLTTTTGRTTTPAGGAGAIPTIDGGGQRIGQDTALPPPMRTTTYWYDTGNGYWTVATWTAQVTQAPTVATVIPPQGSQQAYEQYQTSVNRNVFASAQASASRGAGQARAGVPTLSGMGEAWVGWGIMGVGAILGAGLAL